MRNPRVSCRWRFLRSCLSALAGGFFGSRALAAPGRGHAAVSRVHGGPRRDRSRIRRRCAVRSAGLQRDRRHAARRSIRIRASSIRKQYAQMRERQEGQLLRPRHHHPGHRRRHHRDVDLRRLAGVQEGPAPRRHHRARSASRTRRAGRPSRPSSKLKGPKGTPVNISHQAARLRRPDQHGRRARRSQHHHRSRRVHDRQGHRLHQARRVHRNVGPRTGRRAAEAERRGHEAAGVRPARQSRAARSTRRSASPTGSCRAAT